MVTESPPTGLDGPTPHNRSRHTGSPLSAPRGCQASHRSRSHRQKPAAHKPPPARPLSDLTTLPGLRTRQTSSHRGRTFPPKASQKRRADQARRPSSQRVTLARGAQQREGTSGRAKAAGTTREGHRRRAKRDSQKRNRTPTAIPTDVAARCRTFSYAGSSTDTSAAKVRAS